MLVQKLTSYPYYTTDAVGELQEAQEIIFNFVFWKTCFTTTAKVGIVVLDVAARIMTTRKRGLLMLWTFLKSWVIQFFTA